MKEKTEKINLNATEASRLPLGYKEIHLKKIPPVEIEDKLRVYNKRYKYACYNAFHPDKPVSKILK